MHLINSHPDKTTMALYTKKILIPVFLFAFSCIRLSAQTATDAVMMEKGQFCGGISYDHNTWDEYWEADSLRTNYNIGTLTTQMFGAGFIIGVADWAGVLVNLPYVITKPSSGQVVGQQGIQDINLAAKFMLYNKEFKDSSALRILATAGASHPAGGYFPDATFALGSGCPEVNIRAIVQYNSAFGLYIRAQNGYHLRGQTELNRNYYYTTESYFDSLVNVPEAIDASFDAGYSTSTGTFSAEAEFALLNSIGGFDIRRQDGGFPSNNMEFNRIGLNAHYYPPAIEGLGIHFSTGYIISGRNVGQAFNIGGGISYAFHIWNKPEAEGAP